MSHPLTKAPLYLLSRARNDRGGAVSEALLTPAGAWQVTQDRLTSSRPACAFPRSAACAGNIATEAMQAIACKKPSVFIKFTRELRKTAHCNA